MFSIFSISCHYVHLHQYRILAGTFAFIDWLRQKSKMLTVFVILGISVSADRLIWD